MKENKSRVNYIQHLTAFFSKAENDYRLGVIHVGLYLALFRQWNASRFKNSIEIVRRKTMQMAKIKARSTYHDAINVLNNCGYIRYKPSDSVFHCSQVEMIRFDAPESSDQPGHVPKNGAPPYRNSATPEPETDTRNDQNPICSAANIDTGPDRQSEPILNSLKSEKVETGENDALAADDIFDKKNNNAGVVTRSRPAALEDAVRFFEQQGSDSAEGARFFHYYEGIGWTVGGHSPITNWEAKALNWLDREKKLSRDAKRGKNDLDTTPGKRYDEPF